MEQNIKKGFLQACVNHGCLSMDDVDRILTPLCEAYQVEVPPNSDALKSFVQQLNDDLNELNQTLTIIKHPLAGEEFLVFALMFETPACKIQSHYTDADRQLFAILLETLVHRPNYGIRWQEAYSVTNEQPALKKLLPNTRIQDLVQLWTGQGYLWEKDETLYFGPRTLVEYASHLKMHFPECVQDCPLCAKLVFWDVQCSECFKRIHRDCILTYLQHKNTCPSCKKTWNTRLSQPAQQQ